jgi:hypothetical protein
MPIDKLIVIIVALALLGPYIATFAKGILMLLGLIALIFVYQGFKPTSKSTDNHDDFTL